jgi:hypothetical protein
MHTKELSPALKLPQSLWLHGTQESRAQTDLSFARICRLAHELESARTQIMPFGARGSSNTPIST